MFKDLIVERNAVVRFPRTVIIELSLSGLNGCELVFGFKLLNCFACRSERTNVIERKSGLGGQFLNNSLRQCGTGECIIDGLDRDPVVARTFRIPYYELDCHGSADVVIRLVEHAAVEFLNVFYTILICYSALHADCLKQKNTIFHHHIGREKERHTEICAVSAVFSVKPEGFLQNRPVE